MPADPRSIAADLREAARYCRSHPDEADRLSSRAIGGMVANVAIPRELAARLARNIQSGRDHVFCAPDVLKGYLIGAATEIEGLIGREGGRDG